MREPTEAEAAVLSAYDAIHRALRHMELSSSPDAFRSASADLRAAAADLDKAVRLMTESPST